ncbi:hypothetical protein CSKR_102865 [Clonorchis sinensis]|uniref:Uncharacterized protein n=1 Tax=Clonorchis sinensis TaxID=79923 RepID=A0A3R7JU64_CLOSI|nr:hypothetical protein CSKR_102865 [Clonorchis sinensis]
MPNADPTANRAPVSFESRCPAMCAGCMPPVFNTDASLLYKHDLFECLIVKKRIKVDGKGT